LRRFFSHLLTVPNALSLFRLLSAPLLAVFWLGLGWKAIALATGTLGGISDLFDGVLARKLDQETELGAVIDQLGDLIFESFCLIIATLIGQLWLGWLLLYLFRELTVTAMRGYMSARGGKLPSSALGKIKSSLLQWAFFPLFLGAILLDPGVVPRSWCLAGLHPGQVLLWVATFAIGVGIAVGFVSGWSYLRAFARFYGRRGAGEV
jgi:CDP-diacylglycerol---glycerol-3-phosphate 3-phosphatidyltransferase